MARQRDINSTGRGKTVIMDAYDPADDYEVEHSGTPNPNGGKPQYDQSPIPGGRIISFRKEVINAKGHEIDPEDGTVIDPDRYKDETTTELG